MAKQVYPWSEIKGVMEPVFNKIIDRIVKAEIEIQLASQGGREDIHAMGRKAAYVKALTLIAGGDPGGYHAHGEGIAKMVIAEHGAKALKFWKRMMDTRGTL